MKPGCAACAFTISATRMPASPCGRGETVLTIARLLGHRNPETTLKYTHLADKTVMEAAETVGAVLDAA